MALLSYTDNNHNINSSEIICILMSKANMLMQLLQLTVVEFTSGQFVGSESSGFIEVIVRITGGSSSTPITVIVTPSVQSPVSAMGK